VYKDQLYSLAVNNVEERIESCISDLIEMFVKESNKPNLTLSDLIKASYCCCGFENESPKNSTNKRNE
jgi:hypothetical protein